MMASIVFIFALSLIAYMEYEYRRVVRQIKNKRDNISTRRPRTIINSRDIRKNNKK